MMMPKVARGKRNTDVAVVKLEVYGAMGEAN